MSISQPVIFGRYEWATNLFADTTIVETFNVTLSDSVSSSEADLIRATKALAEAIGLSEAETFRVTKALSDSVTGTETFVKLASKIFSESTTLSDADIITMTKALAESMTLTESQIKTLTKVLTDSTTMTEAFAKSASRLFAESIDSTDSTTIVSTIKHLTDFLVIKEWIAINLRKQITWVNPVNNANSFDTLYGRYTFGSVLFGGRKPVASWTKGATRTENWSQSNGHKYNY